MALPLTVVVVVVVVRRRTCEGVEERVLVERVVETVGVRHELGHLEFDDPAQSQRDEHLLVPLQAHQQAELVRQHVTVRNPVHHLFPYIGIRHDR